MYKGVAEFALHLDSFRNIDLYHQGVYAVRFRIYQEINNEKVYAYPYHLREKYSTKGSKIKVIIAPRILEGKSEYVSRAFLIRYTDEEVDFNEVCHFRAEYDAYPSYEVTYFMEAELLFSDLSSGGLGSKPDDPDPYETFKILSTFKAKIMNTHLGVHEYVPVMFDDTHFCVVNTMFHAVMHGIHFRYRNTPIELPKEEEKLIDPNKPKPKPLLPPMKNFNDFLAFFSDNYSMKGLEKFHNYYIKALKRSYEKLVEFYAYILKLCKLEQNQSDLKYFIDKMPAKSVIDDYINLDNRVNDQDNLDENEERKVTEKPKKLFDPSKEKKLDDYIVENDNEKTSLNFQQKKEINLIAGNFFQTWYLFIDLMMLARKLTITILKEEYHAKMRDRWGESIFQAIHKVPDLTLAHEHKLGENHKQIATARRSSLYFQTLDLYHSVENVKMFPKADVHPILFEEICIKETQEMINNQDLIAKEIEKTTVKGDYKGVHLIVLSHGFQGNSWDMRLFKDNISFLFPDTLLLCASSNEDMTDGEIADMGIRLAQEVINYIHEWIPGRNLGRLSFIGHSLGGLIIRAALPYLEEYADKMHLFMTLSSPHLGYMYHSSKIIDAGLWFLKKWKKSKCLDQLTMTDAPKVEDTYLYKLSKSKGLGWFKNIALLSSFQDLYAPFESARIQIGKKQIADTGKGALYAQMAKNILSNVSAKCIYRIDVNFKIPEKNIDTMIGRAAHIQFLDNQALMRMLVYRYANFFS